MKTIITITFLFCGQFIYSQTADTLQQLTKDFKTDTCGTLGLRLKYFKDSKNDENNEPFFSRYINKKTSSEIIQLLGEPNAEWTKEKISHKEKLTKFVYVIKAKECQSKQYLVFNISFNKKGEADGSGWTQVGFPKQPK